ncbi:2OG-Fe(II) oxygenase [Marinoscillum sp. MHG1-6]|uniref:2OG-Fe(II) oxygenase n=1 Tax=Marinoscillum sp. MHG1-6 TaxID=2959627 RepID=UPI0021587BCC|nr:2OG-Fe(II) oxygenase [Marinoscillum sp. MHG1-6]
MINLYDDDQWVNWVDALSEQNYLVIDNFISDEELKSFNQFLRKELNQETFDKAGIGTLDQFQVDKKIRGDYIRWLNADTDLEVASYFERLGVIIQKLNRYCYLSLSGSEIHLAHYPQGTYYKRHLDQFQQRNNRLISVILYLNENWQEGDGGELKVYLDHEEKTIQPIGRRLVLMRSNLVEHEVLMTHKDRFSITGWLLYQPVGLGFLQPA